MQPEPMCVPPLMGLGALHFDGHDRSLSLAEVGARAAMSQRRLASQDRLGSNDGPTGPTLCDGSPWFWDDVSRGSLAGCPGRSYICRASRKPEQRHLSHLRIGCRDWGWVRTWPPKGNQRVSR